MNEFINFNGNLLPSDQPVFRAGSRAARFGDGIFETMRMKEGQLLFEEHHSSRLFQALHLLRFQLPSNFNWEFLSKKIGELTELNNCGSHARIRLMVTRGEGGIMEEPVNSPQFLIECWPTEKFYFDEKGMDVGIFEEMKKGMDKYSNVKSCNFLPSVMATLYANENGLDECLFLNNQGRVCDATISNIFWIQDGHVFTPALSEGGVAGVMRNYLLECLPKYGYDIKESVCNLEDVLNADELFLTNVIRGIRWVQSLGDTRFSNLLASKIFQDVIFPLM